MLAKHVAQVFYVLDTTNKRLNVVIPGKCRIIGVKNAIDEEEFDQFDEIPPFITSMIKPRIPSTNEAPYLHNDHHEKVKNLKKPIPQRKVAKLLCKICSIWPFMWKFDFKWICVQNMLNVSKYDHLCENMAIDVLVLFLKCAVSEVLCLVSGGHYTESGNSSVSDEEKGRHAHTTHVLYLRKGRHTHGMRILYLRKGRCTHGTRASLLHNMHKKEFLQNIPQHTYARDLRMSLTTTSATPVMLENRGSGNKRMKDWSRKVLRIHMTNSVDNWDHLCVLILSWQSQARESNEQSNGERENDALTKALQTKEQRDRVRSVSSKLT
jgi:hypothetical protein